MSTSTPAGTSRTMGRPGTHVLDHGGPATAPLVLLIHGFGGSALNWQLVAPTLAEHHRVLAVDLYAHGTSVAPPRLTADDVIDQVAAVIDAERAESSRPVILVGGSFGATMALLVARARPRAVSGVLVVNGAIPARPGRRLDLTMTVKRWLISTPGVSALIFRKVAATTPEEYVDLQLTSAGVDPGAVDPGLRRASIDLETTRHHDRVAHESQQHLLRSLLRIFARGHDFSRLTASIDVPVRWLHSDTDPLIPCDTAEAFVASHPGWEFASRPGLGHVPMVVDPAWVADEVLTWIDVHGFASRGAS